MIRMYYEFTYFFIRINNVLSGGLCSGCVGAMYVCMHMCRG